MHIIPPLLGVRIQSEEEEEYPVLIGRTMRAS